MSELFLRTDDGRNIPIQKVEGIGDGKFLVIRVNTRLRKEDADFEEKRLSEKFGGRVIILDLLYGEILSIKE